MAIGDSKFISVLLPTRKRTKSVEKSVRSLLDLATDPTRIQIAIAYDNDDEGRKASIKMAERVGTDKCFEVYYPQDCKDASEFFSKYTVDTFKEQIKNSSPFYKYEFKGMGEILNSLRSEDAQFIEIPCVPKVKFEKDWLCMVSGQSNIGKTSYTMNMAHQLTELGIPTLILPFERGIESVGKRYLQVKFDKRLDEFKSMSSSSWDGLIKDCIDTPIYFSMPKRADIVSTITKSKRLFDTRVVIIDHLDYIIRNVSGSREAEIANTLQSLKRVAEENEILIVIVSHIRKIEGSGSLAKRKPTMEDLKGSSSLYQDPEVVIMLTRPEDEQVEVNVLKNKGEMTSQIYEFKNSTGRISNSYDIMDEFRIDKANKQYFEVKDDKTF